MKSTRTEVLLAVLLAIPVVVGVLLWLYYPTIPTSVLGWLLLLVVGIPTWFFLDWLGGRIFESRSFSSMGSAARIAWGVPVAILLLLLAAYLVRLGRRIIGAG